MNNATTIRALAAIVMVVVLIFTTGTLAAAATSSSFAPQPQNLTCTHPDNNASCSQEGIISTTQISLPILQPQSSATLTNIKHVINDIVGTIFAKDFTSSASDSNVSPQSSFPGA
jgi:ABC-type glycerol-3-phosphate transport system substrate-binding protein